MNLTLYCNTYAGLKPRHTQYNQKNLMCGSYYCGNTQKISLLNNEFIFDDTGKNISQLNHLLGDLTGLYWVWQNTDDEWVGTNQYRRFYDENVIDSITSLENKKLYVSNYIEWSNQSVWQQYISCHGESGLTMLKIASTLKKIPITLEMITSMNYVNRLSPCNMFFGHRTIFDNVCKILFEIILELYQGSKYLLESIQCNPIPSDKRLLAFLAERILNILYTNSKYFLGNVEIVPIKYNTIYQ